jgi:hypothetical protein
MKDPQKAENLLEVSKWVSERRGQQMAKADFEMAKRYAGDGAPTHDVFNAYETQRREHESRLRTMMVHQTHLEAAVALAKARTEQDAGYHALVQQHQQQQQRLQHLVAVFEAQQQQRQQQRPGEMRQHH